MNVFIVYGNQDSMMYQEVSNLLKSVTPKTLQDYPLNGRTIIETLESIVDCQNALFLYSPLDKCYGRNQKSTFRARQNVVFESGYFMAKFGRCNVAFVMKKSTKKPLEEPSDVNGVLKVYKESNYKWKLRLLDQLNAWFNINCNAAKLKIQYGKEIVVIQNKLKGMVFGKQEVQKILHISLTKSKDVIDAMLQLNLMLQVNAGKNPLYQLNPNV